MESQNDESYDFLSLSDVQKKVLAILPIPSALLSVLGSSVIIYMALLSRKEKPWTPYNRLLVAMSICDIFSSITLAIAAFLYPKETSNKAWVFGNDATCSMIGFLNQLSYAGMFYNAMLSYYFLFTARFSMKNDRIEKRIEPLMHGLSVGFPFLTAVIGLFLDVYAEPEVAVGCKKSLSASKLGSNCWVNRWPKLCGEGPDGTGEECKSPIVGWKQTKHKPIRTKSSASESPEGTGESDEESHDGILPSTTSLASSFRTAPVQSQSSTLNSQQSVQTVHAGQNRRLRLVSSQAFLFVGCFFISNIWTYILRLLEAQATDYVEEMELPYHNYHMLVLQAALLPLQGLFNMMVYVRPKYLKNRSDFPKETRFWASRRAVLGSSIKPIHLESRPTGNETRIIETKKRQMVSSLTGHSNDSGKRDYSRKNGLPFSNDLGAISEGESESLSFPFRADGSNTAGNNGATSDIGRHPQDASEGGIPNLPVSASEIQKDHSLMDRDLGKSRLEESVADLSCMKGTGWSTSIGSIVQDENANNMEGTNSDHHMRRSNTTADCLPAPPMMEGAAGSTSNNSMISGAKEDANLSSTREYLAQLADEARIGRNRIRMSNASSSSQSELSMLKGTGWSTSIDSIASDGNMSSRNLNGSSADFRLRNGQRLVSLGEGNTGGARKGRTDARLSTSSISQAELSMMHGTGWSSSIDSFTSSSNMSFGNLSGGNQNGGLLPDSQGNRLKRGQRLMTLGEGENSQSTMSMMNGTGWSSSIDSFVSDSHMGSGYLNGGLTPDSQNNRLKSG
eukprot:scaffold22540_cov137-Cylindrotheca_fusiformis.AAC.3